MGTILHFQKTINLKNISWLKLCVNRKHSDLYDLLLTMPKEPTSAIEMRKQRVSKRALEIQKGSTGGPASTVTLQVLGTGSKCSPRALYVFTDKQRYLFNCGEGTQRLAHEYKTKLAKLSDIFITHKNWKNVGGLPGLVLTIEGIGVPEINLHGPPKVENLFHMTSGFMMSRYTEIQKKNYWDGEYNDGLMKVIQIPIFKTTDKPLRIVEASHDNSREGSKKQKLDDTDPSDNAIIDEASIAFVCRLTDKPGLLLLSKCIEYGVPSGPLLGHLKNGKDVTLDNGTVVRSSDVVLKSEQGIVFIIIECPSEEYLDSLFVNNGFGRFQSNGVVEDQPVLVAHFTPEDVFLSPKYQEWIQRFSKKTEHLVLNESCDDLDSLAVHRIQHLLNMLSDKVFPLLPISSDETKKLDIGENIRLGQTMLNYHLRPLDCADRELVPVVNRSEYIREALEKPEFEEKLTELRQKLKKINIESSYPEFLFLGTGSSMPSKVRNTSSILLSLSADNHIMLDCGEGTYSQLHRFYDKSRVGDVLKNLKLIYISHLHADHHLGLLQLLLERQQYTDLPLTLMAPETIKTWLDSYDREFEPLKHTYRLISNEDMRQNLTKADYLGLAGLLKDLGIKKIQTCLVKHCKFAYGVAITLANDWKFVYSGDTMPCANLVTLGIDCDLLIHEATMEDELWEEAEVKRHSTTSQAIEIGAKMNAKFIILTHFSQRYAKVPIFNENFSNTVGIAFDNMLVNCDQLRLLPDFNPVLQCLFQNHYEDMKVRTEKRAMQKERLLRARSDELTPLQEDQDAVSKVKS